jgi:Ethanolamine utilization protein EutJ (predicted chaperonin)
MRTPRSEHVDVYKVFGTPTPCENVLQFMNKNIGGGTGGIF